MAIQEIAQASTIATETCTAAGDWIPAIAAVLGALVGALAAFIPNIIVEKHRRKSEADLVEASLIAEMTALTEVAKERRYMSLLEEVIAQLQQQPAGTTVQFATNVPPHYSRVYQANAHRIGLIDKDKATDIIRFHQFIDAVVQDVTEGGVLYSGGHLQAFMENHQILSRAFAISAKYGSRT